ncbi:MAG: hypothetical protein J6B06_05880, partial [Lachnospiraceae bacterium]|nr:hypothetical protein [Lachnospiraceae bacterium]
MKKMIVRKLKRCLAGILAVTTVLSSSSIAYAADTLAGSVVDSKLSVTTAEIVAAENDLTESEAAIISSGYVDAGISYETTLPSASKDASELVKVENTENGVTVYAEEYTDGIITWVPSTAAIVVDEVTVEEKELKGDAAPYSAEFDYVGSCSIQVTYELSVKIDASEQERILNIPEYLAEGVRNYDVLLAASADISNFKTVLETLGLEEQYSALLLWLGQLEDRAADYENTDAKMKCLIADGNNVRIFAESCYISISEIYELPAVQAALEADKTGASAACFEALIGTDGALTYLKDAPWYIVSRNGVQSTYATAVFGEDGYNAGIENLMTAIQSVADNGSGELASVSEDKYVTVCTDIVSCNMNSSTVNVIVKVVTAGTTEANPAVSKTGSIVVENETAKADYEAKLADKESEVENAALAEWNEDAEVIANKYTRTVTPAELPEKITEGGFDYVIVYTPNEYKVSTNYGDAASYPYGTVIKLEEYNSEIQLF